MLVLTVIAGPDRGRRFELPDHEPQQIGRSSEALPLTDRTISRRHVELTPDPEHGVWVLRDLESSNGTYVNGVRVTGSRTLKVGDQIRAGSTLLSFGDGALAFARSRREPGTRLRPVERGEMDIHLEHQVQSSDDSVIMSSPEPRQSAQFQLNVLYELVSLVGSLKEKPQLFTRVMDTVFDHFDADRGFILVGEEVGSELLPVVVRQRAAAPETAPPGTPATPIAYSKTIVEYVTRKNVGVLTSNAMNDRRFASGDSVQGFHIHSAMCVPIRYKHRFYGVIHLDSQVANYTYTEDQLALLTAIGTQTGLALANLRLVEARVRAERLAAVGQTVASLSHSIKNILQGLRGGADVVDLGLKKNNTPVVVSGWKIVSRNLERIYELTMNMLAFSKQRRPEFEMTNLNPLLEEAVALLTPQFEAAKVALVTDFAADLAPLPLDGGGLHQAMLNLLSNALDACESEEGVVTITSSFDDDRDEVVVSVRDNGAGMSAATRDRLFEPFHSTKGLRGTGLGLVVTQKIVNEHGGVISVESAPGAGTCFTIRLPIQLGEAPDPGDTGAPQLPPPAG
ncbi:ATP-binding protein [Phycisphaera mikurensis]|uniref:histidine kinase n=1 Tax=Phycisphaera mikurensis (strain NBRC 102666 / KCTC 22515 / FYK2301M01) TaxID=1142394 RepID=I0IF44_PHYMF|nr:ATP-binding protein [Phycisphaera mikurensis]MBB6440722.1 signal transduction histidine kinase/pSer/pThr/pTyr-binding forkhead associated (FHA) protein [Phycisphaera mikurensis]BAM03882.1 putative two-component system sensor histidine kinase [Phycisphaera mikurensis NBRC 102666]